LKKAIIPPPPSTGMTESGSYKKQKVLDAALPLAAERQAPSGLSTGARGRHPGKGDPLFRIVRKPGPSVIFGLPWNMIICLKAPRNKTQKGVPAIFQDAPIHSSDYQSSLYMILHHMKGNGAAGHRAFTVIDE
jgi:hypothetical protein